MSVDRTKVLEAAQKHLARGNYDKAIGELRKIVEADPSDVRTWLKIGDLYTRKGARREAIETYARVAATYADQGFFLKAVAVYKQILKLDPSRLDIQLKLAEQYELLALTSDALTTYEHVAAGYARAGDIERALTTLAKMTDIDPENIPVRIKYAEALSKAGRTQDAAAAFESGAALLKAQGRIEDFIKVAERLLYHRPEDAKLSRELAGLYLERSDPKRALAKLQLCFKADPRDTATLELLAEAFNQLGQLPKTISVYREVARIHQEANRHEDRARALKKILELDPGDAEARQALASFAAGSAAQQRPGRRDIAPPASAVVSADRPSHRPSEPELLEAEEDDDLEMIEEEDDDDLIIVEEEVVDVDSIPAAAASGPPESRSVPPDVQREAQIARLLTECDVFMRYGLKQKVVEQLKAVLEIEPAHVEARERLKDLYLGQGRVDAAIVELLTLADVLSGERSAAAVLYLRQILELDPSHQEALARLDQLGIASVRPPPMAAAPAAPASQAPAPDDDVLFLDEEQQAAEGSSHPSFEPPAEPPITMLDEVGDEDEPSTDITQLPVLSVPRPALVPPPSGELRVPKPSALRDPDPDPLAPMSPAEFDEVPLRPSSIGELAPEGGRRSSTGLEVEEILDEADFFVAQGLFEEARGTLADALANHPGNLLLEEKLRDIGALANAAALERSSQSAEPLLDDQSFELAERLAEELDEVEPSAGSDVLDVEQVFAQFKKGVAQQVAMEDSETHFDLGIAYKEMGLLDDAMNEFRLCLSNPQRICIAETMIGLCHMEKGDLTEAIAHFKKGLYAETKTDREELGLYFELGNAYDLLHDPKEALYYYQKVQKRDPNFRDVGARIQALATPRAPAPAAQPMAPDDIDRAFDDLMGED